MPRLRPTLLAIGASLVLSACADTLAITSEPTDFDIAVHEASAPPLETYEASFWAVQGRQTTFRIRYRQQPSDTLPPFFSLVIPQKTQLVRPDGSPLANRDSVLISLALDTERFEVAFAPDGLMFSGEEPMMLTLFHSLAARGVGPNGKQRHPGGLSLLYRPAANRSWERFDDALSLQGNFVVAPIHHFSGYAIAW